ncbi:MAG: phosphotransferase family protein [Leptospira sp.]|nr:phosphotransferase family protein [Leptospira sp.]
MSILELKTKLESYFGEKLRGKSEIPDLQSLSGGGGACQDNYLLDLNVESGDFSGVHKLVLRTDKGGSLFSSLSKSEEFGVCQMAHNAGVKTPKPFLLETNTSVIGNPFYTMERISGKANGRFIVKDPSLGRIRKNLADELASNLSKIHTVSPDACKDPALNNRLNRHKAGDPRGVANSAVADMRSEIENLKEPHPAIELVANWLEKEAPETDRIVLVHGDFRTGNFMVSPNGLEGIIDWEFAHWGDRHEDISWLCMRDWRFGKLNKEAGGFADRFEFYEAYEKHSGIKVDAAKVTYWEVMGNLRWAIGSAGQAERHISGKDKGIELAAIGRRTSEMEMEAMRLIENAG